MNKKQKDLLVMLGTGFLLLHSVCLPYVMILIYFFPDNIITSRGMIGIGGIMLLLGTAVWGLVVLRMLLKVYREKMKDLE